MKSNIAAEKSEKPVNAGRRKDINSALHLMKCNFEN